MIEHVSGLINFTKAMDPFLQQKGRHLLKLWRDAAMVGADQMRGSSTDELTEYPITKIKNWSGEEYGAIVMGLVALQETGKLGDAEPSFRHIVGKVMGTVKTSRAYEPSGIEFQSLCGCLKRLSKLDVSRPVQDEQDVRFVWAALIGECLPARCQTEISLEYRHNFSDAAVTKSDITMFVLHRAFSIGYAVIEVQPGEDEPHKDHHKAPVELYEQITKFLHATAVDMAEIEQFRFHYGLIYRWRIEWFCVYPIVIGDLIVLKRCIGPSFAIGQYTTRLLAALNLFEYIVKEVLPTGELIQRSLARSQTPNADIIAKLAWRQPNAQPVSRRTKCLFTPAKSRQ
ncbi:hypothetical protein DFS34DRAFT_635117 [Phlyctochytrium arcticum]|nr:hypothetical protein DFS34DRAFT_635117 [Phlyctochytrium arcticum]